MAPKAKLDYELLTVLAKVGTRGYVSVSLLELDFSSEVNLDILDARELFQLADIHGQDSIVDLGLDAVAICILWESELSCKAAEGALKPLLAAFLSLLAAALALSGDGQPVVLGLDLQPTREKSENFAGVEE